MTEIGIWKYIIHSLLMLKAKVTEDFIESLFYKVLPFIFR